MYYSLTMLGALAAMLLTHSCLLPSSIATALPQPQQASSSSMSTGNQQQTTASTSRTAKPTLQNYATLVGGGTPNPALPNFVNFTSSYLGPYLLSKQPQAGEFLALTQRLATGKVNEYQLREDVPATLFIPENRAVREVEQQFEFSKPKLADYYMLNHLVLNQRVNITTIRKDSYQVYNSTFSTAGYSNGLYVVHFISSGSKSYGVTDVYVNCARIISGAQVHKNLVVYIVDRILQAPQAALVKPQYYRQCSGTARTSSDNLLLSAASSWNSEDDE